jgi:Kef-type K+ transport system membrane component KefB
MEVSFAGLVVVAAVAFGVPIVLGLVPRLRLPAVVVEIIAGIVIGPSVLGWVRIDAAIEVLSVTGLAFLLFLAGLEIELERLRGLLLRAASIGFLMTVAIALAFAAGLSAAGLFDTPLLIAIMLSATSLGVVVATLKDAGLSGSDLGQLVIAAASIADFAAVVLLSLFFSGDGSGPVSQLLVLGGFVLLAIVVTLALVGAGRRMQISSVLVKLQDTTAQIRVRGAVLLMVSFVAIAQATGLEAILAAFVAGAVLGVVDRDAMRTHPQFRVKLDAVGYGVFIPVFFVASGISFDLAALGSVPVLVQVPIFLAALVVARGVPAILYRRVAERRQVIAAALLQATSLPFIVAAAEIGMAIGSLSRETGAAMIAAGLCSVVLFPTTALALLRRESREAPPHEADAPGDVRLTLAGTPETPRPGDP